MSIDPYYGDDYYAPENGPPPRHPIPRSPTQEGDFPAYACQQCEAPLFKPGYCPDCALERWEEQLSERVQKALTCAQSLLVSLKGDVPREVVIRTVRNIERALSPEPPE